MVTPDEYGHIFFYPPSRCSPTAASKCATDTARSERCEQHACEMRSSFTSLRRDMVGNSSSLRNSFGRALTTAGEQLLEDDASGVGQSSAVARRASTAATTTASALISSNRSRSTVATSSAGSSLASTTNVEAHVPCEGFGHLPGWEDTKTVQKIYDQHPYPRRPLPDGHQAQDTLAKRVDEGTETCQALFEDEIGNVGAQTIAQRLRIHP